MLIHFNALCSCHLTWRLNAQVGMFNIMFILLRSKEQVFFSDKLRFSKRDEETYEHLIRNPVLFQKS
jgi:hypothetical protein